MDGKDRPSRSGTQFALDAARVGKALVNIIRAAIASGLYGAAIAAAKEAMPLLIKVVAWLIFFFVLFPLLVFVSLPNIFFGFDSADAPNVSDMTQKALSIGSAYMSLEDFEREQMDTIVTYLVSEYAEEGVAIDEIKVTSSLNDDDLCWLIAINSVAKQQNLSAMSAVDIQSLSISRISYIPSLLQLITGEGELATTTTTLKVDFDALDPEELMDELAFDDEAKNWAEVLFNTLSESDALNEYGSYFTADAPSYGGDTGYSGEYLRGDEESNDIDISGFVSPGTKNNLDLAAYAMQAYENSWGYVWGTYGNVLTQSLLDYKIEQYPDGVGNHEDFIEENWLDRRTTDCVGLIKGYGWLDKDTLKIGYAENGMPDYGANQMYEAATVKGTMDTMPDVPGVAVWKKGHIGVYVGDGKVVEAMGTKYGVVMTELEGRGWSAWCEIPFISYMEEES